MSDDKKAAVEEARKAAKKSCREVSQHILTLLPTVEEGLERMSVQLKELKIEASTELFQDVVKAVQSIANALPAALFENPDIDKLTPSISRIRQSIASFVSSYEAANITAIESCLATELLPAFKAFRQDVEDILIPLVSS